MKRKLIKIMLMLALTSFTVNNAYSYNVFGKIIKPKSDKADNTNDSQDTNNKSNGGNSDKVSGTRTISNSAGSITLDSQYNSVGQNYRERFIILHYTALNRDKSLSALTKNEVSAHFLVSDDKNDPVFALVPEGKRAWHAGDSEWKNSKNLNDSSLGIEIVNDGDASGHFVSYKTFQIKNVAVLVKYLAEKYEIPATNILGHSDIAPQRKSDPGPLFPWKELYTKHNIGMWYDEATKQSYESQYSSGLSSISVSEMQKELKKFGYSINISDQWDKQAKNVVRAFQHHFRPSKYDGVMDVETYSILKALNEKYNKK